ncbi:helix-turn-helix transcriptional regulator [Brevibacterium sp. 50QC2O2]|jgi:DNA-binding HxlR family transcriptional regulator|uniref:winged helix-turn-helix transcriptional regulator n=1 Tax=unclassified Brevibacterium TaxID=2614124 RepID=UPI00211C71C5|nr:MULTISPECIES: helix-turn-helix domain-containing protein [unclassified Brevibacterium]MCQ9369516.1 helix-turn-helix transcriptional regulator [Brevibacterium sp. 91QC2O2]MCQ9389849.1 helix-turn-helix transcriptional regulator [Brevibacterium sp. 50QC2O2]
MATIVPLSDLPGRPCPIAASLELVGERWALLVIREIAMDNHRFSEIVRGTGAPRDRIAARLKTLESEGIVMRRKCPDSQRHTYHLTEAGADLIPVLNALLEWGQHHAVAPDDPKRKEQYPPLAEPVTELNP